MIPPVFQSACWLLTVASLAVCGNAVAQSYPPPMNLTRYMPATASSVNTSWGGAVKYAVDGLVCDDSRWISADVNGPHWLQVDLGGSFQIGSANVITGGGDAYAVATFSLQYWTGSAWSDIPGATITGNTKTQRQIIFSSPVTTTMVRFYTSQNGWVAVKELAIFPPNGGVGYPIGTEIDIRSGMLPKITASSYQASPAFRPFLAYDGFVSDDSRWLSAYVTSQHWLEYDFVKQRDIAYAHIYTGLGAGSAIANYTLQYWDAATTNWVNIPGGSVTGNTSTTNILTFSSTISTTEVRLVSDDDGNIRVKEMVFLPPNGGTGYPVGAGVTFGSPPSQKWSDFSDNFYTIKNRVAGMNLKTAPDGTVTIQTADSSFSQQYNILLNIGTDTYRLCNRANQHCLEVAAGSLVPGAIVQEGDYNARPYQQWRLNAVGSGYYEMVNVYSGLLLTVNGSGSIAGSGVVQESRNSSYMQQWTLPYMDHFPKKGSSYANVSGDYVAKYDSSHYYNWGLDPSSGVTSTDFQSMWWNNSQSRTERLVLARADWAVIDGPKYIIGYNEPNHGDQANMSVQDGLDEWSRMEQVKLPLVGPQHDYAWGSWYTTFFDTADAMGMRIDEGGGHIYPTASSVNYEAFSTGVSDGYYANNNRVQWVTEWNWVNWGGAATWTDDQLYSVVAETLWRYENNSWVKRHEFFAFSAYWANGAPGALEKDGNMLPMGRLYAAWDGDLNYHTNTWYILHNRGTHKQMQNTNGAPVSTTFDTVDSTINWYLSSASSGKYYIVSSDGKRLSYNGSALSLAAIGTTGTAMEWALTPIQYGWYYLDHPATGTRLDSDATTGALAMYGNVNTWDTLRWRFIKPYQSDAIPLTWVADASGNWSDATKWSGGFLPADGTGYTADFCTLNITADRMATLDSSRTIGTLRFGDTLGTQNWTLAGSGGTILTLDDGVGARPVISVSNNTATISASLTGENGFDKTASGTLILAGSNSLSGTVNIDTASGTANEGAVRAVHPDALTGVSLLRIRSSGTGSSALQLDGSTGGVLVTARFEVNPRNNDMPAIQNLAGTNWLTGDMDLYTGGDRFNIRSDAGLLVISGRNKYLGTGTAARAYAFSGAGDHVVTGPILESPIGSPINLTKTGTGTLTLDAQNTYNGTTTVSGGTLVVNGATGTGATTVASGATLASRGTVRNNLTAQSGATVRVGGTNLTILTETLIDDLSGGLSSYISTRLYDANGGPANGTTWQNASGLLTAGTTTYDGIEQLALTRTDVALGIGQEIRADYKHNQLGSQDIGLYAGAGTPTLGVRSDYVNIYVRDHGDVYSRGFDGTTELGLVSGGSPNPDRLFIAHTGANSFELGYYKRGIRVVVATRTMSNSTIGNAIGFYADVRSVGIRGSLDNLTLFNPNPPPVSDTLTVQNTFTLSSGATLEMNLYRTNLYDRLMVGGQFNAAGTLQVRLFPGAPAPEAGNRFQLFSAGVMSGVFGATNLPSLSPGLAWKFTPTNGVLSVVSTVATNPTNITTSVSSNMLTLSWPADHTGWTLLAQTNPPGVGLGSNWFSVGGSSVTNQMLIPISSSNGSVFYRLVYTNAP